MKARILTNAAVILITVGSGIGWGIENPTGIPTVPQTSFRSGLVRSGSPIGTDSQRAISIDISSGRYFLGIGPGGAVSDFGGGGGPLMFDSFLRSPAGSGGFLYSTGGLTPYYSQREAVSVTGPGGTGFIRQLGAEVGDRFVYVYSEPTVPNNQAVTAQGPALVQELESYSRTGVVAIPRQEVERRILTEVASPEVLVEGRQSAGAWQQAQALRGLAQGEVTVSEVRERSVFSDRQMPQYESERLGQELMRAPLQAERQREVAGLYESLLRGQEDRETGEGRFLQEQVGQDQSSLLRSRESAKTDALRRGESAGRKGSDTGMAVELQELLESAAVGPSGDGSITGAAGTDKTSVRKREALGGIPEAASRVGGLTGYEEAKEKPDRAVSQPAGTYQRGVADSYGVNRETSIVDRTFRGEAGTVSLEQRARAILGPYQTVASFTEAKFNQHVKAAEEYLRRGMYYRAADAYKMALVYKPGDVLAYGGRSHALFAAGEYVSSAFFLSEALEAFAEYGQKLRGEKKELGAGEANIFELLAGSFALIGRDKLESRAADVEQWYQSSDAPELQFILAYVYYQMGRGERAKEAIKKASEKMAEVPAIIMLKSAIESAPNPDNTSRTDAP